MRKKKVVIVGISGPSSSGKSVLPPLLTPLIVDSSPPFTLHIPRILRSASRRFLQGFPSSKWLLTVEPDEEIPIDEESGLANWDCAESLDLSAFVQAIQYIRRQDGQLPPDLDSKEDQNELGQSGVPDDIVTIIREEMTNGKLVKRDGEDIILCFVDGFLLYSNANVVRELDVRLLVRAPYEKLRARREARSGYVTLDGFWQDPPGYFDKIVWKWYVKDHEHFFEDNDINGPLRENKDLDLQTAARMDLNMQELLMWAIGVLSNYLQDI